MIVARYSKILKNKVIGYVLSRYLTYAIQFINSLFIAVYLGPYYLGILGFISLIIQYIDQFNLGIAHSENAIISVHKNRTWYVQKVVGSSIAMFLGLSFIIVLLFVINELFNFNIGNKYGFSKYCLFVVAIGILGYLNSSISTVFRVYGKLFEIAFSQTLLPVLMLLSIVFFRGEQLLWALVICNLLSSIISFILFYSKSPVKIKPLFINRLFKYIQIKGWYLFIYNTSFYLIIISTRSFISGYYSVVEFGYFTFAYTMANVGLLLLESLSFIIYPKLLNRFASTSPNRIVSLLDMLRNGYITTSHLLIYIVIFLFPLFLYFFPQYEPSKFAFYLIALTLVLYTNSFGYSGLLIAKENERALSRLTLLCLLINLITTFILINIIRVSFSYVIMATMVSYLFFILGVVYLGRKQLNLKNNIPSLMQDVFPLQLLIPFLLSLCLIFFQASNIYFIIPLAVFVCSNIKTIINLKQIGKIIMNPRFIDI
jgi:O-antigen/teichoic acid export membrane protein